MVDVTKEDREAAARYWGNDNPPLELQREFARHRIAAENAALEEAAATITDLRARIAELEADKAQWVENERMQLGISAHTPQSTPAHSPALTAAQGSTPPE